LGTGFRFCRDKDSAAWFIWIVSLNSLGLGLAFYGMAQDDILYHLIEIKNNNYKHPPNAFFLSFSLANAFVILACVMILEKYAWLKNSVISDMGKRPLFLFVTHFFLIFVVFSRLIGKLMTLTTGPALTQTCILLVLCYLCLRIWNRTVDLIYQPGLKSQDL